ncbi:Calycin [Gracilaria domingensis]|nr:Calycin [Gracilaria domingensis]
MEIGSGPTNYLPRGGELSNRQLNEESWEGYLKNLGTWIGKRALSNPSGKVLIDIPTRTTAERFRTPQGEDFVLWRFSVRTADGVDEAEEEWSRSELADLGSLAVDGSFSVGGDMFCGEPMTVDQCLVDDSCRIRTTHAFDWEGCISGIIATRERIVPKSEPLEKTLKLSFVEPAAWRSPQVLFDYILGLWEGKGISVHTRTGQVYTLTSRLKINQTIEGRVTESSVLRIGEDGPSRVYDASGRIDGNFIIYAMSNVQVFLLPGGVSVASPIRIRKGRPFTIESAFLMRPDCRKRVLRVYNNQCEWVNTVFINERRVG